MSFLDLTTLLSEFLDTILRGSTAGDVLTATGFDQVPTWQSAGGGGASLIHQATFTLSNDEIKGAPNPPRPTPIPTPGANRMLWFIGARSVLDVRNGIYTNISADAICQFTLGSTDVSTTPELFPDMLADNSDAWAIDFLPAIYQTGVIGVGISPFVTYIGAADITNQPFRFTVGNTAGNFTGGDASNTWLFGLQFGVFDRSTGLFLTTTESGWNQSTRTFS